jgi:hypothetical protein
VKRPLCKAVTFCAATDTSARGVLVLVPDGAFNDDGVFVADALDGSRELAQQRRYRGVR